MKDRAILELATRSRDFVLNRQQEQIYLEFAPRILHDTTLLMLDSALGPAEALALEWRDIHFEASPESPFGHLRVRQGKTRYRSRVVSLTSRIHAMLRNRKPGLPLQLCICGGPGQAFITKLARAFACTGPA